MEDHVGESLVVIWKPASADTVNRRICVYIGTIPFRNLDATTATATLPTDKRDIVVLNGYPLTIDCSSAPAIGTLTVNPNAQLKLTGSGKLQVDSLMIRASAPNNLYGQLAIGEGVTLSTDTIYLDYELDVQSMYTFAAPGEVTLTHLRFPIICEKNSGTGETPALDQDYYIDHFDGYKRANDEAHKGFTTFSGTTLAAATGYTVAAEPQLWGTRQRTTCTLRFPIPYSSTLPTTDKAMPLKPYGETTDPEEHRGWNLVGNPYFGTIEEGGTMGDTEFRYYTVPDHKGNYTQETYSDLELKPFHAFFVQTDEEGSLVFKPAQQRRNSTAAAPARYARSAQEYTVGIRLSDGTDSDKTEMLIGEAFDNTYEFNADLAKWQDARPVRLYTLLGTVTLRKMTFSALEKDDNLQYAALYLHDNETGATTNLLYSDYTFLPTRQEDDSRFTLSCVPAYETPTDNKHTTDNGCTVRVAIEGDGISLHGVPAGATIRIYDTLGHLHYTAKANTDTESIPLQKGIYLIHISTGSAIETIKVVL